jgi:RHS repeat-associated protein
VTVSAVTKYYMFGGQRVAMRQGDVVYYLHSDHLGSTSLTTDITGTVVAETRYLPYGEERWKNEAQPTDFTFTGQRAERGFGLMDYNARYYDSYLNRFISADTVVPEAGNPQSLNRYSYAINNPLGYIDPSGHDGEPWWTRAIQALKQNLDTYLVSEHDASVLSIGVTGGARVTGLGPAVHSTIDVVSNEKGQIQVFYTEHTKYHLALLSGDEDVVQFTKARLGDDPIIPQIESNIFPQVSFGLAGGFAEGGSLATDVQEYGGLADVFSLSGGELLSGSYSISEGYDPNPEVVNGTYEDRPYSVPIINNVQTVTKGVAGGFSLFPVSVAHYGTESTPLGPQIDLPYQWLVDTCKVVGGCGNQP